MKETVGSHGFGVNPKKDTPSFWVFRFGFDPGCGPILIGLSWHDAGVFNGKDGCPNAAMRMAGGDEYAFGVHAGGQKSLLGLEGGMGKSISRDY